MIFILKLIFLLGIIMVSANADELNTKKQLCESKWLEISSARNTVNGFNYEEILSDWKSLKAQCSGTGIYEIRLASTYLMLNNNGKARDILKSVEIPEEYLPLSFTVELNIDLVDVLQDEFVDPSKVKPIAEKGVLYVSKYPEHLPLYSMVGHLLVLLEDYVEAVPVLEKAITFKSGNLLGPYRNLGIAYAYTGKYEEAAKTLDEAYNLNNEITSDEVYMYALAISYAALGRLESAENVINLIVAKKPYVENDQKFKEAIEIINSVIK